MSLKTVRVIQWLAGALLLVYGIYLIFGVQEFFGTLAIIAAFFIFPSLEKRGRNGAAHDFDQNDHYSNSAYDTGDSSGSDSGGDSGGGGGD